jgi:hypothetical protein
MQPQLKRTYIRGIYVGATEATFELPQWKPGFLFTLPVTTVPHPERQHLHPGFRCCVDINFDAQTVEELNISNWGLY